MADGAQLFNIPGFQRNRDLLGYQDGGLHNPPALTFDPTLNSECQGGVPDVNFTYPVLNNVTRPADDKDLAFMTVSSSTGLVSCRSSGQMWDRCVHRGLVISGFVPRSLW